LNHDADAEDRQPYLLFRTINKMVREDYSNKSEIIERGYNREAIIIDSSKKGLKGYVKDHISKGEIENKVALLNLLEQLQVKKYSNMIVVRGKLVQ
jgi:hypothetical protein